MKRFMLMHIGFENPTPEIMAAWGKWFERVAPQTIENVGLRRGREINRSGTVDLAMGPDAVTGYTIVSADSLDEAHKLAASNPFVGSIRIYELMTDKV
jgi:hypothetical protein